MTTRRRVNQSHYGRVPLSRRQLALVASSINVKVDAFTIFAEAITGVCLTRTGLKCSHTARGRYAPGTTTAFSRFTLVKLSVALIRITHDRKIS